MQTKKEKSRREFVKSLSLGACLVNTGWSEYRDETNKGGKKIALQKDDTILFQGDSITYWYRQLDATTHNDSHALGSGYALLTAGELLRKHAGKNLKFLNKGISGNTIRDLEERWDRDCLSLKPNVLSILIGVNDYTMKMREPAAWNASSFRKGYADLLDRSLSALPGVKLIIAEPFAVNGLVHVTDAWFPAFHEYRQIAKDMAATFGAAFIPLQTIFDKVQQEAPASYWTGDGIHPSLAGAQLMSDAWLNVFRK